MFELIQQTAAEVRGDAPAPQPASRPAYAVDALFQIATVAGRPIVWTEPTLDLEPAE